MSTVSTLCVCFGLTGVLGGQPGPGITPVTVSGSIESLKIVPSPKVLEFLNRELGPGSITELAAEQISVDISQTIDQAQPRAKAMLEFGEDAKNFDLLTEQGLTGMQDIATLVAAIRQLKVAGGPYAKRFDDAFITNLAAEVFGLTPGAGRSTFTFLAPFEVPIETGEPITHMCQVFLNEEGAKAFAKSAKLGDPTQDTTPQMSSPENPIFWEAVNGAWAIRTDAIIFTAHFPDLATGSRKYSDFVKNGAFGAAGMALGAVLAANGVQEKMLDWFLPIEIYGNKLTGGPMLKKHTDQFWDVSAVPGRSVNSRGRAVARKLSENNAQIWTISVGKTGPHAIIEYFKFALTRDGNIVLLPFNSGAEFFTGSDSNPNSTGDKEAMLALFLNDLKEAHFNLREEAVTYVS